MFFARSSKEYSKIVLPVLTGVYGKDVEGLYSTFHQSFKQSRDCAECSRVAFAIMEAAHRCGIGTPYAAKILVELGLKAPRESFCAGFLQYADDILSKPYTPFCAATRSVFALALYWGHLDGAHQGAIAQESHIHSAHYSPH